MECAPVPKSTPSRLRRAWLGRSLAGLLLVSAACSQAPAPRPNILLISVDSLRADHVSAYGHRSPLAPNGDPTMPAVDQLAAGGVLFRNAMTTTSWTLPSHMALMTGMNDSLHGVMDNAKSLDPAIQTLAEALKAQGYQTGGFYTGPNLHETFGFSQGFDAYKNASGDELPDELFARTTEEDNKLAKLHNRSHHGVTSPLLTQMSTDWLDQAAQKDAPFFLFMHFWDPHYNYEPPDDYAARFDPNYTGSTDPSQFIYSRDVKSPRDMQHILAMYYAEIRYTDDHIAHVLKRLDELGLTEETLVVFTADHGDEFFEHGKKGHQRNFFTESIHIPLVIRYPGKIMPGTVVEPQVRIQDVLPTICELLDIPVPPYVNGMSLVDLIEGGTKGPPSQALELNLPRRGIHLSGLRNKDMLVVWDFAEGKGEYFDLHIDPRELKPNPFTDLETSNVLPVRLLREQLAELAAQRAAVPRTGGHSDLESLPEDLTSDLEAMGYLGALDDLEGTDPTESQAPSPESTDGSDGR